MLPLEGLEVETGSVMERTRHLLPFKDIALACEGDTLSLNAFFIISYIASVCDDRRRKRVNV